MHAFWQDLTRWIVELVPAWDAAEISAFRYLEGGYSNDNYRFSHAGEWYVLRVPRRRRPRIDRAQERAFYGHHNRPDAPELVALDVTNGRMITRWVAGRLLADLDPAPARVVAYLRDLHARLPALPRVYDPVAEARAHLGAAAAPGWITALAAATEWRPPAAAACHNDLNPWNVIEQSDGRWITLDWEWLGMSDPLFDLVTLHQSLGFAAGALAEVAHAYLGTPPASGRLDACLIAFWLREYAWANEEASSGNGRPEIVAQRELGASRLAALTGRDHG
jgi:aminoglycoside phosphotransferase (APT) family kinase protein